LYSTSDGDDLKPSNTSGDVLAIFSSAHPNPLNNLKIWPHTLPPRPSVLSMQMPAMAASRSELRSRLLSSPNSAERDEDAEEHDKRAPKRLLCLDAFRGLIICVMILVDDAGPSYNNVLNHAPWDGLRLAVK
jgi:hypothetical protein